MTAGDKPFVLDVRQGLPSGSATELNRKGLMLPSRFSVLFFFLLFANSLMGIVYPPAVKSTPRTGSSSPKGAVRSGKE